MAFRGAALAIAVAALIAAPPASSGADPARRGASSLWSVTAEPAPGVGVVLRVSLADQMIAVEQGGRLIAWSRVSTGRADAPTRPGVYRVLGKKREHVSTLYPGAEMPHMMRLTRDGMALHGGDISTPHASGGCIRMPDAFAAALFQWTRVGAFVEVTARSLGDRIAGLERVRAHDADLGEDGS